MRAGWAFIFLGLLACGASKKEPTDPSSSGSTPDETPKWEGAGPPTTTPKAGSSGGRTLNEAPTRKNDEYDKEATEIVLKRAARQVKENCGAAKDDNGKALGPWGKTTIQIVLGHNGHGKDITVPAPYQGKPTGNCVAKAFAGLAFPPWAGSDTTVDWEIELVQPGK